MAQKHAANVERLPTHMQSAARAYIEDGREPTGFLRCVLENDLVNAIGRADTTNRKAIKDWTMWMFNDIPSNAWGDTETILNWCQQGGLNGE